MTKWSGGGTCEQFVDQWACSLSPPGTQLPNMMSPLPLRIGLRIHQSVPAVILAVAYPMAEVRTACRTAITLGK